MISEQDSKQWVQESNVNGAVIVLILDVIEKRSRLLYKKMMQAKKQSTRDKLKIRHDELTIIVSKMKKEITKKRKKK